MITTLYSLEMPCNGLMWYTHIIFHPWNVYFPADGKVSFLGWNTYLTQ